MDTVTVSPKYQVVIPLKERGRMRVRPGQKMHVSDMKQGKIIEIDESLALSAAILWTQDEHFKDLDGVKYMKMY